MRCSAFVGYLYILGLINGQKVEHTVFYFFPPTSYLVESRFSWVTYLLWKVCNWVVVKKADLRLSLTTLWLDTQKPVVVKTKEQTEYNANF